MYCDVQVGEGRELLVTATGAVPLPPRVRQLRGETTDIRLHPVQVRPVCMSVVALFPGLSHLRFLIAYSLQTAGKAWEVQLCVTSRTCGWSVLLQYMYWHKYFGFTSAFIMLYTCVHVHIHVCVDTCACTCTIVCMCIPRVYELLYTQLPSYRTYIFVIVLYYTQECIKPVREHVTSHMHCIDGKWQLDFKYSSFYIRTFTMKQEIFSNQIRWIVRELDNSSLWLAYLDKQKVKWKFCVAARERSVKRCTDGPVFHRVCDRMVYSGICD